MRSARQSWFLLAMSAVAVTLVVALLVWVRGSSREMPPLDVTPSDTGASSPSSTPPEVVATPESDSHSAVRTEIAKSPAPTPHTHAEPSATPVSKDGVTLVATFTRPDKKALELASASVELRSAKGVTRRVDVQRSNNVRITGLVPSLYVVRVIAPEFDHREQFLDLTHIEAAASSGSGEPVFGKRLVLWPAEWIAVIVETTDGRPFSALATDLGYEPMNLFVGAFHVHTQIASPGPPSGHAAADPVEIQTGESALARFRPPPDYKSWELTKSCVGSLELLHQPPMWVELELFGKPLGWESLQVGAKEIVFRMDRSALEERFARVTARIVDPKDHAPVAKALVTLRSDTSAHRRGDLTNQPSGDDGRIELARIVPGRYEFAVARGESQHQQMIELGPSETRDLGDIALGDTGGFDVLVVDEDGKPAAAWVEVGPYKKGARSSEIYPHMMRHSCGEDGKERLPMPSEPAIVRAAIEGGRSFDAKSSQEVRGVRSANVLVDPRSLPQQPLRLVLKKPVKVRFTTKRGDDVRIEVLDELDVVVAHSAKETDKTLDAELVPGRYRARAITPDGTVGAELPFTADGKQPEIEVD